MKNSALLSAIAAGFALAACSGMMTSGYPDSTRGVRDSLKGCKAGNCMVKLTVAEDRSGNCTKVTKDPDPRGVWDGGQRNVKIVWQIVGSGAWEFDANGIDFRGDGQFQGGTLDPQNKKKYTWTDTNDDGNQHDYWINLVNPATGKKCTKDPSVVNDTTQPE